MTGVTHGPGVGGL